MLSLITYSNDSVYLTMKCIFWANPKCYSVPLGIYHFHSYWSGLEKKKIAHQKLWVGAQKERAKPQNMQFKRRLPHTAKLAKDCFYSDLKQRFGTEAIIIRQILAYILTHCISTFAQVMQSSALTNSDYHSTHSEQ